MHRNPNATPAAKEKPEKPPKDESDRSTSPKAETPKTKKKAKKKKESSPGGTPRAGFAKAGTSVVKSYLAKAMIACVGVSSSKEKDVVGSQDSLWSRRIGYLQTFYHDHDNLPGSSDIFGKNISERCMLSNFPMQIENERLCGRRRTQVIPTQSFYLKDLWQGKGSLFNIKPASESQGGGRKRPNPDLINRSILKFGGRAKQVGRFHNCDGEKSCTRIRGSYGHADCKWLRHSEKRS